MIGIIVSGMIYLKQYYYTMFPSIFQVAINILWKGGMYMWIYSTYITIKGKRIYASQYGLKVFRFWVDKDKLR